MSGRTESPPTRRAACLVGAAALALAALVGGAGAAEAQAPRTVTVQISARAFRPAVVRVAPGTTVRWVNRDRSSHTATSDIVTVAPSDDYWDSGRLGAGASFAKTFSEPGTWSYHCALHAWMTGTVVVHDAKPGPDPTATRRPAATPTRRPTATPVPTRRPDPPAPTVSCRDWSAWRDLMPWFSARRPLTVTGQCDVPSPGYAVQLRYTQQGINPAVLLLETVVRPPRYPVVQVPTTVRVTYRQHYGAIDDYTHVTILPEGTTVEVGEVW